MENETNFREIETNNSSFERSGLMSLFAKTRIGSFLLDKAQIFIESQEVEINELNRQVLHDSQTNAEIT